jgi:hypothetical protein
MVTYKIAVIEYVYFEGKHGKQYQLLSWKLQKVIIVLQSADIKDLNKNIFAGY